MHVVEAQCYCQAHQPTARHGAEIISANRGATRVLLPQRVSTSVSIWSIPVRDQFRKLTVALATNAGSTIR
jgi:hypothetical protein